MDKIAVESPAQHDDIDGIPSPAARERFVGHAAAYGELSAALDSGKLHHAWLLQGPAGIGKATMAFVFARQLLAAGGSAQAVSRQIAHGSHPGLIHLARPPADRTPGFRTQITVDEVRRLTHFFHTTSGLGWRVAIIDPADDMNRNAANALLKVLEEPPERSLFLIVNHMPGRLLPTIRSRCRVLRLSPLPAADIASQLRADVADADAGAIRASADSAAGSMRTAFQRLVSGGMEVGAEARRLYGERRPDWAAIQKLADMLTIKGREAALDLMTRDLFAALAQEAESALEARDFALAERLAAYWQAEDARWREAQAYNLDRKQVLISFFAGLAAVRG